MSADMSAGSVNFQTVLAKNALRHGLMIPVSRRTVPGETERGRARVDARIEAFNASIAHLQGHNPPWQTHVGRQIGLCFAPHPS